MKSCPACFYRFDHPGWRCPACGYQPPFIAGFPSLAPELANSGGGYRAEFYADLAAIEAGNFWFQARNELIIWAIRRYFSQPRQILEIGCGTGFVLSALAYAWPDAELTGSEIFSTGLAYAASRTLKAEFLQMDARQLPFEEHFDLVAAFDVLEHIVEDELVLAQIYQAVRPGGGLVLTVPQHPWLWSRQDDSACHVRRYTAAELRRKVVSAGFNPLYETSFVSLLLPLMILSRLRKNRRVTANDPMSELRLGRTANKLLGKIMTAERNLIQRGLRFPMGGSRLLAAKKN